MQEKIFKPYYGLPMLMMVLILHPVAFWFFAMKMTFLAVLLGLLLLLSYRGFITVQPNRAKVLLLFGVYKGTIRSNGFYFINPFYSRKDISLRIRNFETGSAQIPEVKSHEGKVLQQSGRTAGKPLKVNDKAGNPIEISAVVVWKVVNPTEALFEVDDFENYVTVQSEAALRNMASRHPYDSEDDEISLRKNPPSILDELKEDIQDRLNKAGIEVIEARLCHLAYAPEIASAMLQRQQAEAVVSARAKIVEGAVGMVEMAVERLAKDKAVKMSEEQKSDMVANLMVILCGDRHAQPVIDVGKK